jgi:peptidoglycan/LPS O-acetylase OafA/YrhL
MNGFRWGPVAGLLGLLVGALAVVAIPVFLIRPFAAQTPGMLDIAYTLRRWSPLVTAAALAGVLLLGWKIWRRSAGLVPKAAVLAVGLLTATTAWMARQNHFEWMFAPLPNAGFVRARSADFVRGDDMVLAVALHGDAVAYPVNQLAYHHLIEDSIGRVPIVATY